MTGSNTGTQVAIIGLGNMGSALAEALISAGYGVTVWSRTAGKCAALVEKGASAAGSVAEAAAAAEVVIVCITDHAATEQIIHDADVGRALHNKLLVQLSTISADQSRETAAWAGASGCTYLEGSILGLPSDVTGGSATIVYAGPREAFDDNRGILLALGGDLQYVSEAVGAAVTFDKVIYAFAYGVMHAFVQGAAMAHAKGVPIETYTGTVAARLPNFVWKLKLYGDMIARRNYDDVQCTIEVHAAAFAETLAMCRDLGVGEALPAAVMGNFERAIDAGYGQQDIPALFEVLMNESAPRPQQVSSRA
jgi:3-hydroxyisobutyrate dehydrogenase-like beta-hydroxyacid dehydrogenase